MTKAGLSTEIDCTTCKYGYKDEQLGIPLCHHPKRFSEDCVDFNMHEEKESEHLADARKTSPKDIEEAAMEYMQGEIDSGHDCLEVETNEPLYYPEAMKHAFIAGAKWMADHTPLPEDTVLFNKGVEEGKRLMMEEAVEGRVSYFESRHVAVIYYDDPKGNTMCFFAPSSSLETGDKVKIIIVKEDKK